MSGLFGTLNIAKRAMGAQQYALNTTSHNIANSNTEGYSRQTATMEASRPQGATSLNSTSGPGQLGTGVEISEITRARDFFLDVQIRYENSTLGKFEARDEFLSEIEVIFMEPTEYGLSTAMGEMWNSWQELSRGPENSTLRIGVTESSKSLTDMLNHTYSQLENLEMHSGNLAKSQVFDFNQIIKEVENLNEQIRGVKISSSNPNDLMDKQDLLIDKLSKMSNISVARGPLGDAQIMSDGNTIVGSGKQSLSVISKVERVDKGGGLYDTKITYLDKGDSTKEQVVTVSDNDGSFYNSIKDDKMIWTDGTTPEKVTIKEGSIMGYASIYTEINEYKSQLNALARAVAYSVNTVHNNGLPTTDASYVPFFVAADSSDENTITAKNITVNTAILSDLSKIKTQKDPADTTSNNGDRALAIGQLRDSRIYMNQFLDSNVTANIRNTNTINTNYHPYSTTDAFSMRVVDEAGGSTLDIFFRDSIAKLGSSAREASGVVTSQKALLDQLNIRKESISGVSMDEEMTNMIQYQRAFQAAARVVSTLDELLDVVVNGLKR